MISEELTGRKQRMKTDVLFYLFLYLLSLRPLSLLEVSRAQET